MLLSPVIAAGIRDGSVTAVFRRWDAPRARPGGTQRTAAGVVRFDSVEPVDAATLTEADALGAGMASLAAAAEGERAGPRDAVVPDRGLLRPSRRAGRPAGHSADSAPMSSRSPPRWTGWTRAAEPARGPGRSCGSSHPGRRCGHPTWPSRWAGRPSGSRPTFADSRNWV